MRAPVHHGHRRRRQEDAGVERPWRPSESKGDNAMDSSIASSSAASASGIVAEASPQGAQRDGAAKASPFIEARDGALLFHKDWGTGRPVLFLHSWSLNADMWDYQMVDL